MSARRRASLGFDTSCQGQQEQASTRNCDFPEQDPRDFFIKVRPKGHSAIGWVGWLIVCSFSLLAPSALLLLHTFRQHTGSPAIFDVTHHGYEDQSQENDFTKRPGIIAMKINPTQAEQLDLQTGFVVSSEPTTREYVLNLTRENYAPDGFEKSMILINGQSPGPLIEANTGDVLRITVNNFMPDASTTVHWHGIDQRNTSWMDGAYGVSQCGIPPGGNFTYRFNVTGQRGTFWYHSHVSAQYTDGLYGPLIIHDPDERVPLVDDEKIMMFGDLFHQNAELIASDYLSPHPSWGTMFGMVPPPDNLLLNGMHVSNCSSSLALTFNNVTREQPKNCKAGSIFRTRVKAGERIRLRLISHSTSTPFWFSIDNHILEIVEIDGVEAEPIPSTRVFINSGQRYSVIMVANQTIGNYRIRATADTSCSTLPALGRTNLAPFNFEATGIMSYGDVDSSVTPIGSPWDLEAPITEGIGNEPWTLSCRDLPFDLPKPMRNCNAYEVGERNHHYFTFQRKSENGLVRTSVNGTYFSPLEGNATIWKVPEQDFSVQNLNTQSPEWDFGKNHKLSHQAMFVFGKDSQWQNFQVVGEGPGEFGSGTTTWNYENPLRRDTITIHGHSHVVLRILADNPGVWPFHCHILWHAEGLYLRNHSISPVRSCSDSVILEGMFVTIAHRLEELSNSLKSLDEMPEGPLSLNQRFCYGVES
ncbi:unnamed protein product [Clonostachys rosea]|uniref:Multicopper oxidase n=1 Tax=Bionectria ochroleuca TaxID=29856 RepID=A0ABY6U183_BIOOC|nr:unnamed protein product [Clonostachys rosea]